MVRSMTGGGLSNSFMKPPLLSKFSWAKSGQPKRSLRDYFYLNTKDEQLAFDFVI
jgi:hypothetical protein